MKHLSALTQAQDTLTDQNRVYGFPRLLLRVGWCALAIFTIWMMVASLQMSCINFRTQLTTPIACSTWLPYPPIVFSGLVWIILGLILCWRKSDDWLVLLIAALFVMQGATIGGYIDVQATPQGLWLIGIIVFDMLRTLFAYLAFALFPNGRFVPRWTLWLVIGCSIGKLVGFFLPGLYSSLGLTIRDVFFYGCFGVLVLAQIYRYRCVSGPIERLQTRWFLFSMSVVIFVGGSIEGLFLFSPELGAYWPAVAEIFSVLTLIIPFSLFIAILRYRLWDITWLIQRTLVYGLLTTCVIGLYILLVSGLGSLLASNTLQLHPLLPLLATGLIAVLFQPLRERLQRAINHLLYGERDEPYVVLSRLGQRLEMTLEAEAMLPMLVETIAHTFNIPYVAVALQEEEEESIVATYVQYPEAFQYPEAGPARRSALAAPQQGKDTSHTRRGQGEMHYGKPGSELLRFPLTYHAEVLGELLLAPRSPGEPFSEADKRLLTDLARQAGAVAHAVQLTADLQHSRERLVTAREEERRRLRRDLHDGLGPALASLTLKLDAARNLLRHNPDAATTLLLELKAQTQRAIADIRRLVYELRPPTLDELGLVSALHEQGALYQHSGLTVTLELPTTLPQLPAAHEVAIYRITQEALTNVVRHAQAQHCTIALTCAKSISLEIRDDGCGIATGHPAGVGLTSMRERATELGGTCRITSGTKHGTCIIVTLPLPKEH